MNNEQKTSAMVNADAFANAVMQHLGPIALNKRKISVYDSFALGWDAGIAFHDAQLRAAVEGVSELAVAQFRKDWPFLAARLDAMREKAGARAKGGLSPCVAPAPAFDTPSSNTGVNNRTNGLGVSK